MGLFGRKKENKEAPLSRMSETDRERAILSLEESREDVVVQIEQVMSAMAGECGRRRWRARGKRLPIRMGKR